MHLITYPLWAVRVVWLLWVGLDLAVTKFPTGWNSLRALQADRNSILEENISFLFLLTLHCNHSVWFEDNITGPQWLFFINVVFHITQKVVFVCSLFLDLFI